MPANNTTLNHLKPERLEFEPTDPDSSKKFTHWLRTLQNYTAALDAAVDKLAVIVNFVGHQAYPIIEASTTYDDAVNQLKAQYLKPVNEIYARHILATHKQSPDETLDDYLRNLRFLAKDCNFAAVTAVVHHDEAIRDSFIAGIRSNYIRQRLLENNTLDLATAFTTLIFFYKNHWFLRCKINAEKKLRTTYDTKVGGS